MILWNALQLVHNGVGPMGEQIEDFFDSPSEHSKLKALIVSKYVQTWARILSGYLKKGEEEI